MSESHDPLDSPIIFTISHATSIGTRTSTDQRDGSSTHHEFLRCLGVAQYFKVDLLPIIWQPASKLLGLGATAQLHQAPVNLHTDFAFKRFVGSQRCFSAEEKKKYFRALVQEITILSIPTIRSHPNIINLMGLCWDVEPETGSVWPVPIFEKSQYGNLRAFMQNGVGRCLDLRRRLELCADIARAVICLHANGDLQDLGPGWRFVC